MPNHLYTNHLTSVQPLQGPTGSLYYMKYRYGDEKSASTDITAPAVKEEIMKYHESESDIQQDYYNCNFYYHLDIGKWDKPFVLTSK